MPPSQLIIGIVGPSKSGKSTLKRGLEKQGYIVKHIAQEHSFAPTMWQVIANPDVLIYLDVSYERTLSRGMPDWKETDYLQECKRLKHARLHADFLLDTKEFSPAHVLSQAETFIANWQQSKIE